MGKRIFPLIMMAVIGGAVIVTAQIGDGGHREKKVPVQADSGTGAAKAEKSNGTEGKETPSSEGGTIQSGKEPVRKELMDMYFEAFCKLIQSNPGLGENAPCLGFDFSKAGSLTQSEGEALAERLKEKFHKEKVIFGTWEELKKAGYIKKNDGADICWEDGMLLTLEVTKEKKKRIVFSISAWRSGLGAVGKDDCEAERTSDGKWKIDEEKPVNCWIS